MFLQPFLAETEGSKTSLFLSTNPSKYLSVVEMIALEGSACKDRFVFLAFSSFNNHVAF